MEQSTKSNVKRPTIVQIRDAMIEILSKEPPMKINQMTQLLSTRFEVRIKPKTVLNILTKELRKEVMLLKPDFVVVPATMPLEEQKQIQNAMQTGKKPKPPFRSWNPPKPPWIVDNEPG